MTYVGPVEWTPAGPFDKTIEADRMIAMPGMVNAHCHSPANLVRGMMPSKPLEIWRAYYRASLRDMRDEDFYASALLGGMEMLKNGATTVLDHFAGNQACRFMGAGAAIQAMRDLGLRHVAAFTMTDKNYEDTIPLGETDAEPQRRDQAHERERSQIDPRLARRVRSIYRDIPRAGEADDGVSRALGGAALQRRVVDGSAEIARQEETADAYPSRRNQSAGGDGAADLWDVAAASTWTRSVYWTPISRWRIRSGSKTTMSSCLRERGATPVHNPASNLRIGSGLAPVKKFLAAGVNVGLGTDGAASNDGQNMFDAMRLAALIHNQAGTDFNEWVTPAQALAMATRNGARAFGLDAGVLAPGKLADIVLLRRDTPAFTPLNDVIAQLVFCENGGDVDSVIVNGEIVVEGGG